MLLKIDMYTVNFGYNKLYGGKKYDCYSCEIVIAMLINAENMSFRRKKVVIVVILL